jgi:predicted DNA binding CopG/RHH family protein
MNDPFKYLDEEEKDLIESVERGEWKRVDNFQEENKKAASAAKSTLSGSERMDICLPKRDANRLKMKALKEGISYQALISSIIHRYLDGQLDDHTSLPDREPRSSL